MKLVNIMTYAEAEVFPGPQLNVVLGPNGTGKSSIVCGMVLGFGGKPAFLGRGKEISDFIRKGTDRALIEIEVFGGEGKKNLIITREMRKDNTSIWRINGKNTSANTVREAVERLNVQVENLCSFLPQDRVSSFAELDPAALLRETELAIDGEDLVKQHDELIKLKKDEKNLTHMISETEKEQDNNQKQNRAVEGDVMRFQRREEMLKKMGDLRKKRPWLEFEAKRTEALETKKKWIQAKRDLTQAESRIQPIKDRVAEQKKIQANCDSDAVKIKDSVKTLDQRRMQIATQLDDLSEKTEAELEKRDGIDRTEKERERSVEMARQKLAKAQETLESAKIAAREAEARSRDVSAQQERIKAELSEATAQIHEASNKRDSLRQQKDQAENQLKTFDQPLAGRLRFLQERENDVYRMHAFIQQNKDKFRDKVYGPVALEINVPNKDEARQLESALPDWLRLAFVVLNDDDARFLSEVRTKNKWRINTVTMNVDHIRSVRADHQMSPQQLRAVGLEKYLDEVFDTPAWDLLKKFIVDQASLNTIGIRSTDDDRWDYQAVPLGMFFSKSKIYTVTVSRYGNRDKSTVVRSLREVKYFAGIDQDAKAESQRRYEAKKAEFEAAVVAVRDLEPQRTEKSRQLDEIRKEFDEISNAKKKVTALESIVKRAQNDLQIVEQQDPSRERARIEESIKRLMEKRFQLNIQHEKGMKQVIDEALKQSAIVIRRMGTRRLLQELEAILIQHQGQFDHLKNRVTSYEAELNRAKALLRQLRDKAEQSAPLAEHRELFETLPSTIEEIDAAIDDMQARVNSIIPNPEIVKRYEERKRRIEGLASKLEKAKKELERAQTRKAEVLATWLPRVQEITTSIGVKFSKFFDNMGCKGAVRLHEAEQEDFEKYGVEIMVSYRASEPLQQLAASRQSGGEKSVATMLYLVSLQQLSDCPFRLVDEINQGMDPKNERMIFEQVTRQASQPNTPQYFLITPKLLPDLFFEANCTVLTVLNGPWQTVQKELHKPMINVFGDSTPISSFSKM
jgi:structural maintenance of chromosomes protein 5